MTTTHPQLDIDAVHVRWWIRRDMPEVLAIEEHSFEAECRWDEDEFMAFMRQRNAIGMVAEHDDKVVGYMMYELHKNYLLLAGIAVAPQHRRHGVGAAMIGKLVGKLHQQRRSRIKTTIRDSNLSAQLFFRSQGFIATEVLRGEFEDRDEDGYLMEFFL
jgi:[ribosomal protein S18]-alanine N-acetyltransferase